MEDSRFLADIRVKGARENNLKNIDVTVPRNKLVVFTGLSGSGKSSLAFDTIFAEGQRRYIESLSSYARQFLGQMDKPDVDYIEGLSPAISIDQKTTNKNPRSTVGTVTEIYDFLRLLYANIGIPHCPVCGREIKSVSVDQINNMITALPEGTKALILAPIARERKGEFKKELENLKKSGYVRVKVDGEIRSLDEKIELEKNIKHTISAVVDRLVIKGDMNRRLTDSVETALRLSDGLVAVEADGEETLYSTNYACAECGISIPELSPRMFSFNSPFGACPDCSGLGVKSEIDPKLIVKNDNLTLNEGAVQISGWNLMDMGGIAKRQISALARKFGFSMDVPFKNLPEKVKDMIFYGTGDQSIEMEWQSKNFRAEYSSPFEGIANNLKRRYAATTSEGVKLEIERFMTSKTCETCGGKRLRREVLAVTFGGKNISDLTDLSVEKLIEFLDTVQLTEREKLIGAPIFKEIKERLNFLKDVGLSYLALSRASATLSGGESQRIRLATQIGSGLTGVIYILDEPSIGLHQRDNRKLLGTLKKLRDLGNTLIVVEHDEETIASADHIVDIGPFAGERGGYLVATGTVEDIKACPDSITGDYLAGRRSIPVPAARRLPDGRYLTVKGGRQNNLKNVEVSFPVGVMTAVTGVSGSGKSSLVRGIVYPRISNFLNGSNYSEGDCDGVIGEEYFDKIIDIDQSPIGRTPRSNPATYIGVFTAIRELFAATPDAKARNYNAGRFSFNVKGGRCENCSGDGAIEIEMHFLPDVFVPCEVCGGKRYNRDTLDVKFKGKSIYDVLEMTVEAACVFFENIPKIYTKLKCLLDVGLGYIRLGQSSTTLSGGEAQRVKLAAELSKRNTGKTLYLLDEPTTGLHMYDVDRLLGVLARLVDGGNTIIVIEHNLDVIKTADYVIDLGPEGGDAGGKVIAAGTPEEIAGNPASYTGIFLKPLLKKE